jgi:threonine/homoserine/homoserine lactone efflux protein
MTADTWLAFALFAFVSSITPGPNNTLLLASGVNFGFARSLPHMAGVTLGFCLMILLMGLGLGNVFARFPVLYTVLRYVGGTYMLYLAWKIFRSQPAAPTDGHAAAAKPMGFTAAAAFQWVNPKAWVMALGSITTYLPTQHTPWQLLGLVALMGVINMPTTSTWALFGSSMRRHLQEPRFLRIFNTAAALALVASLYPLLTSP